MVVSAKVKATGNLAAGQVLQMVCIERVIEFATPPGTNGEKVFESVMKKMLPSPNGTTLPAMQAGDSVEYTYKWSITKANGTSEYYNIGRAAAVAFVQNNTTKEVLGAGYDAPRPWLAVSKLVGAFNTKIKSGDEVSYGFRMSSKTSEDQIIKVKGVVTGLPAGWSFQVIDNGTIYGDTASIPLAGNTEKDIEVKIIGPNAGQSNKKIVARVEVNSSTIFPDVKATQTFVAVTPSNILFIDHGGTAVSRFTQAFNAATQAFVTLNAEEAGELSADGLEFSNIKKIFYSTGASFAGTINTAKAEAFTNYLNSGGNLFAIGQDIGYEIAVTQNQEALAFMNNYLGADYLEDGTTATITVSAVEGETLLAPYFTSTLSLSGTGSFPDQLEPYMDAPNAVGFLKYSNDNMAAIYNYGSDPDTWKTVFVGFRIEAFGTSAAHIAFRNNLIGKSNDWFDNTLTSNELAQSMRTFRPAFPNPAKQSLNVSISGAKGSVVINDITGKQVQKEEVMANAEGWANLNVSGLKPGVYFLQTVSNGVSAPVQKITIE